MEEIEDFQESRIEDSVDIKQTDLSNIIMYSRDWTIGTIYNQIKEGNIELNPRFQRRNAWKDDRRSRLIESIIIGYPIPEIVLAQDLYETGKYIVIDGKQRLLTIAGYFNNEEFKYWDSPKLIKLDVREDLNGLNIYQLPPKDLRSFENSSLRCTVIGNYGNPNILYDIFYRLNTGTVKLSTQELRQVLNRGEFANFLLDYTDNDNIIRRIIGLSAPDERLNDIEVLLRIICFILFPTDYHGNIRSFLDQKMNVINSNWNTYKDKITTLIYHIEKTCSKLTLIFGDEKSIGQKPIKGPEKKRFNRVLLEVLIFFFSQIDRDLSKDEEVQFIRRYVKLCQEDMDFQKTLNTTTKSLENYRIRYSKFLKLMTACFKDIDFNNPFEYK